MMRFGLQLKLTLSHLAVTLISVAILVILVLGGYLVYLQTDLPALWVADQAYYIADDIAYYLDGDPLTEEFTEEYIFESGFVAIENDEDFEDLFYEDWIIVFDSMGQVVGSNDAWRYPQGSSPNLDQLPGFDPELFDTPTTELLYEDPFDFVSYAVEGQDHIGMAVIISVDYQHLGWVYYRAGGVGAPFSSTETVTALVIFIVSAALIATVVSGIAGGWLSLSFSKRLQRMSRASAALASGDLNSRVPIEGKDEIDQLGQQFNTMADQLTQQLQDLRSLADHNAMLAEEAHSLAAAEERNRLARELHDAVKQQVFALSLTANSIRQLYEKDPQLASERLTQLETQARDVHLEMDAIIKQLRPASLKDQGLAPALTSLVEKWETQNAIPIELGIQAERELQLNIEQALYRIAQEALNNISRHAQATQVVIMLEYGVNQVTLSISDNGVGFNPEAPHAQQSLGLRSMHERAAEIEADLDIKSNPDTGTQVSISVQTS